MWVDNLRIPEEIAVLINLGIWPKDGVAAGNQSIHPIVSREMVSQFAPEEHGLYFYPPPFQSLQQRLEAGSEALNSEQLRLDQIEPRRVVIIGDFGLGSDTAIALEYLESDELPRVIRLQWARSTERNVWVEVAKTFLAFCQLTNINSAKK